MSIAKAFAVCASALVAIALPKVFQGLHPSQIRDYRAYVVRQSGQVVLKYIASQTFAGSNHTPVTVFHQSAPKTFGLTTT